MALLGNVLAELTSWRALRERVSDVVFLTGADGVVVVDDADGVDAACARTRILTGVPDASLANRTICAQDAFWSA